MRQTLILLGALALLVAPPLAAAEPATPLRPGKPAGVKPAQADRVFNAYTPALALGALLAITIGISGSSVSSAQAQAAVTTANCCG
ncbi:MAG TPA: hypothetical protein VHZ32_18990 [Rhizomicrobium sp.]|nr:hypothetical protein [Rhizomicrobium sp.]